MDQGLAIKAHGTTLGTFCLKAILILEGIIDAIQSQNPMRAGGKQAVLQGSKHRGASRC